MPSMISNYLIKIKKKLLVVNWQNGLDSQKYCLGQKLLSHYFKLLSGVIIEQSSIVFLNTKTQLKQYGKTGI